MIEAYPAIARGQLFALPLGYPALTTGERMVHGFVLVFADSSILLELDDLEDYHPERSPDQNEYERHWVEVFSNQLKSLGYAWIYKMSLEKIQAQGGELLTSNQWHG